MQAVLARVAMLDVFARVEMVVWVFLHGCKGILGSWLSRTAPTNGNRHFLCFCRMSVLPLLQSFEIGWLFAN